MDRRDKFQISSFVMFILMSTSVLSGKNTSGVHEDNVLADYRSNLTLYNIDQDKYTAAKCPQNVSDSGSLVKHHVN